MNPSLWRTVQSRQCAGFSVVCASVALNVTAQAHPVVFADGTAVMGHHLGKMSGLEIVYSPNWYTGIGLEAHKTPDQTKVMGQASLLAWRGNFPDLQTNFYLSAAVGKIWSKRLQNQESAKQNTSSVARWSTEWDAEDREYYGRIKYAQHFVENRRRNDETLVRFGFAPYKAKANEPAIWGILEWKSETENKFRTAQHEITPLMRYFYKNALFEIGSSLSGKFAFNYMYHFF